MGEAGRRVLRARIADGVQRLDQPPSRLPGPAVSQVFQITDLGNGNFPTDVMQYFAAYPTRVSGPEVAGGQGTLVPDKSGGPAYLLLLGVPGQNPPPPLPKPGDFVVADECGGRWCFEFKGTGSSSGGCCDCIPQSLTFNSKVTSSDGTIVPFSYFNSRSGGFPKTFTWGAPPVTTLAIPALGSLDPAGDVFQYIALPAEAWFATGAIFPGGFPITYWLYVDDCNAVIVPFAVQSITVYTSLADAAKAGAKPPIYFNTGLRSRVTVDGYVFIDGLSQSMITGQINSDCDKIDVTSWSYQYTTINFGETVQTAVTRLLELTGSTDSAEKDCIHLDDQNSAGLGTTHDITDLQGG